MIIQTFGGELINDWVLGGFKWVFLKSKVKNKKIVIEVRMNNKIF